MARPLSTCRTRSTKSSHRRTSHTRCTSMRAPRIASSTAPSPSGRRLATTRGAACWPSSRSTADGKVRLRGRSSQSVEPILAAYRIAARVAWDEILRAWRGHPEATPEAIMLTANYVFAALDQVAAEVTKTYLHAREQHMQRGTRAHARLFHALISDNFDSELELQKQALALNMPIVPTGYVERQGL